jgi:hypothetical protein
MPPFGFFFIIAKREIFVKKINLLKKQTPAPCGMSVCKNGLRIFCAVRMCRGERREPQQRLGKPLYYSYVKSIVAAGACCSMFTLDLWKSKSVFAFWTFLINVSFAVAPLVFEKCDACCYLALDFCKEAADFCKCGEIDLVFLLPSVNVS